MKLLPQAGLPQGRGVDRRTNTSGEPLAIAPLHLSEQYFLMGLPVKVLEQSGLLQGRGIFRASAALLCFSPLGPLSLYRCLSAHCMVQYFLSSPSTLHPQPTQGP